MPETLFRGQQAVSERIDRAGSPRSPWPDGTLRFAFWRLSAAIERPASTTVLNDVPGALRRTNSLLVPVSINSRREAFLRAGLAGRLLLGGCHAGVLLLSEA